MTDEPRECETEEIERVETVSEPVPRPVAPLEGSQPRRRTQSETIRQRVVEGTVVAQNRVGPSTTAGTQTAP